MSKITRHFKTNHLTSTGYQHFSFPKQILLILGSLIMWIKINKLPNCDGQVVFIFFPSDKLLLCLKQSVDHLTIAKGL